MKLSWGILLKLMRSRLVIAAFCGVALLITMRSILGPEFFRPHDYTHAARLVEMQRSLQSHEFPVRWSRNFGFGYGMPLFNFYAPLPYYLGTIPLFLGLSPINTIKILYLLNGLIAFTGMFLLGRKLWGKWGGLLSAIVFSFSSYRALDLFVRGAVGESFAMVLIPFALWGVQLVLNKQKAGLPVVILSLSAIILSHNLTGLAVTGILVIYWLGQLVWESKMRWTRQGVAMVAAFILAVSLSAFYAIPAFTEKNLTRVDQTITVGYFDYHNHFLCYTQLFSGQWKYGASEPGCTDDLDFDLGITLWGLLGLAVISILGWGRREQKVVGVLLLVLLGGSLFMTIGRSTFIWDHLPLLKYFQFPWRFLAFAHVFAAALAGAAVLLAKKIKLLSLLVEGVVIALVILHAPFYWPETLQSPQDLVQYYDTSPQWIRTEISKTLNDYLPPRVRDDALPFPTNSRFSLDAGNFAVEQDLPTRAQAVVSCPGNCVLTVNNFQYPGWVASVDGKAAELRPVEIGLPIYTVALTKGDHLVNLAYHGTNVQLISNFISLVSAIFLFVWWLLPIGKRITRLMDI